MSPVLCQNQLLTLYEDISDGVTKEIIDGQKEIIKSTTYDVTGNRDSFEVQIDGKTQLSRAYESVNTSRRGYVNSCCQQARYA